MASNMYIPTPTTPLCSTGAALCSTRAYEPLGSACLTFDDDLYYELCDLMYRRLFGVPDEITDMTRSLEMVES